MTNTITVDNQNIIHVDYYDVQTEAILLETFHKLDEEVAEMQKKNLPAVIFSKIHDGFVIDVSTRLAGVRWAKRAKFNKMAILAGNETYARIINFVLSAVDQTDRVQVFLLEKQALSWLVQKKPSE